MFLSAFLSFVVYTLIFLRLRGNLYKDGSRFRFRRVSAEKAKNWRARPFDDQGLAIARQMLLYVAILLTFVSKGSHAVLLFYRYPVRSRTVFIGES